MRSRSGTWAGAVQLAEETQATSLRPAYCVSCGVWRGKGAPSRVLRQQGQHHTPQRWELGLLLKRP